MPATPDLARSTATPPSARAVALALIDAVLHRRHALDEAFDADARIAALAPRDRAFARLIAATTLRRLGQIDDAVSRCLERPLTPKAQWVRSILRAGAAQLLFLGTPAHAAVGESVALASGRLAAYRPLVNAVLRRLARDGAALVATHDAARLDTPDWLWRSWSDAYGEAVARRIAEAHLAEPPLDITLKAPGDAARWAAALEAELLPTGTLRRHGGGVVTALAGYDQGAWWVQDAAATLPARLLGPVAGRTVVDLCAAPGGKTAQLAAQGARVIAVDRSQLRLGVLRGNLARLGLDAEPVVADAAEWRPAAPVDAVLLDAPCTSTGTIRRHPDLPHLKTPDDVARLTPVQDRLLDAAMAMLRPGGVLVYCVCSLQPEEGPQRIAALRSRDPAVGMRAIVAEELGGLTEMVTRDGELRSFPFHLGERGGVDGFFAARLVRS